MFDGQTYSKKDVFIFDVDGTLTDSRQRITLPMRDLLYALAAANKMIVFISGADIAQMKTQVDLQFAYYLSQSGNMAFGPLTKRQTRKVLWKNTFSDGDRLSVISHIELLKKQFGITDNGDMIDERGGLIAFSLVGHHAASAEKKAYDTTGGKRMNMLRKIPHPYARVAGTTCIDYSVADKGKNVERFLKEQQVRPEDAVFFGDQLYRGGNDYSVLGIVDTVEVKSVYDTFTILHALVDRI